MGLLEPRGKVIVYYYAIGVADSLSKSLNYAAYYSKVTGRKDILKRFISSDDGTIVTTSSLGIGLNLPGIGVVLYIRALRSLVDYA
jgi:superfamily II DNA helicase RecQ